MPTLAEYKTRINDLKSGTARLSYVLENFSHIRTLDLRAKEGSGKTSNRYKPWTGIYDVGHG